MANEVYTLESLREVVELFRTLVDAVFPDKEVFITVQEGGFTPDHPWKVYVKLRSEVSMDFDIDSFEMVLNPQTVLDQVDHGGTLTAAMYASGMFSLFMNNLITASRNPKEFQDRIENRVTGALRDLMLAHHATQGEAN